MTRTHSPSTTCGSSRTRVADGTNTTATREVWIVPEPWGHAAPKAVVSVIPVTPMPNARAASVFFRPAILNSSTGNAANPGSLATQPANGRGHLQYGTDPDLSRWKGVEDEPPLETKNVLDYLEKHRDRFLQPLRVTFSHIFLSASTRGNRLEEEAEAISGQIHRLHPSRESTMKLSDPFRVRLDSLACLTKYAELRRRDLQNKRESSHAAFIGSGAEAAPRKSLRGCSYRV